MDRKRKRNLDPTPGSPSPCFKNVMTDSESDSETDSVGGKPSFFKNIFAKKPKTTEESSTNNSSSNKKTDESSKVVYKSKTKDKTDSNEKLTVDLVSDSETDSNARYYSGPSIRQETSTFKDAAEKRKVKANKNSCSTKDDASWKGVSKSNFEDKTDSNNKLTVDLESDSQTVSNSGYCSESSVCNKSSSTFKAFAKRAKRTEELSTNDSSSKNNKSAKIVKKNKFKDKSSNNYELIVDLVSDSEIDSNASEKRKEKVNTKSWSSRNNASWKSVSKNTLTPKEKSLPTSKVSAKGKLNTKLCISSKSKSEDNASGNDIPIIDLASDLEIDSHTTYFSGSLEKEALLSISPISDTSKSQKKTSEMTTNDKPGIDIVSESESDSNSLHFTCIPPEKTELLPAAKTNAIDCNKLKEKMTKPVAEYECSEQFQAKVNVKDKNSNDDSLKVGMKTKEVSTANEGSAVNKAPVSPNTKIVLSDKDLQQYIGDITELDFDDIEMDDVASQSPSTSSNSQNISYNNRQTKTMEESKSGNTLENWRVRKTLTVLDNKFITLPTRINFAGNSVFRFFWWDAFEDPYKQPGIVYLFGKVPVESDKNYVSCCVAVKNVPKQIYVLPRKYIIKNNSDETEPNTFNHVYSELKAYMNKNNIREFRCKQVSKNYAFERKDVPQKSEYLEVRYSASYPAMDPNYSGRSIQAIFGSSTTALELFLLEKNIKGPCWLDVKIPPSHPVKFPLNIAFSWCKIEISCTRMEDVSVTRYTHVSPTPPIVMATLNIQVSMNPTFHENEVASVGILLHSKFHLDKAPSKPLHEQDYYLVTHSRNIKWPTEPTAKLPKIKRTKVMCCETELDLLEKLLEIFQNSDPDVVIGYDTHFQLEVLLNRIFTLRVKNWSRIGKLKQLKPPYFKGKMYLDKIFCGRPVCDIQTSAKELNLKVISYDLPSLCEAILNEKKQNCCEEIKPEQCQEYYVSVEKLNNLVESTIIKTSYILRIAVELGTLPLALQMTNIAGNTLSRTLAAGISERNEFLLLHAFHGHNYLIPDKKNEKSDVYVNKKSGYVGGLVLDPKQGFYDTLVLLMDFKSLYPSIIQEFNICFTTVRGAAYTNLEDLSQPEISVEVGILPTEVRKLVESRAQVKKMLQNIHLSPDLRRQYNIRQLALKLTANSMYGCLGATHSRFYAKGLAAFVAMKGREILQSTKELVQGLRHEVIYGDTDSIMINSKTLDYEKVMNIGKEIKSRVNRLFKRVELDIDRIFKYMLLLKKKQYAAMAITKSPSGELVYTKEIKGLDIVRRDRCSLACDVGNQILDQLLSEQPSELLLKNIFEMLEKVSKNLQDGNFSISSLEIVKQLSKNPDKYTECKYMSHVLVAQRLNKTSARKWKAGDAIPYIVCEDGTKRNPSERAYHIEELNRSSTLKIDINYYLLRQIYPVVLKICDPIEGIDEELVAQHLGIQDIYKPRQIVKNQEAKVPQSLRENRFENCTPFIFICKNQSCKAENRIKTVITEFTTGSQPSLAMCSNPECDMPPWKYAYAIKNKLQLDIRKFVTKYYLAEVICDNPLCSKVERRISLDEESGKLIQCQHCFDGNFHRIYKETDLYNQLTFFLNIFTLKEAHYEKLVQPPSTELVDSYDSIKEFIMDHIENSAYYIVDLTKLFSNIPETDKNKLSTLDMY